MTYLIAGIAIGWLSAIASVITTVGIAVMRADKKHDPPTKEEWNMERDCMWG